MLRHHRGDNAAARQAFAKAFCQQRGFAVQHCHGLDHPARRAGRSGGEDLHHALRIDSWQGDRLRRGAAGRGHHQHRAVPAQRAVAQDAMKQRPLLFQ